MVSTIVVQCCIRLNGYVIKKKDLDLSLQHRDSIRYYVTALLVKKSIQKRLPYGVQVLLQFQH